MRAPGTGQGQSAMRILLHCNAGPALGIGHVLRSIALAEEAIAAGHSVVLAAEVEGEFVLVAGWTLSPAWACRHAVTAGERSGTSSDAYRRRAPRHLRARRRPASWTRTIGRRAAAEQHGGRGPSVGEPLTSSSIRTSGPRAPHVRAVRCWRAAGEWALLRRSVAGHRAGSARSTPGASGPGGHGWHRRRCGVTGALLGVLARTGPPLQVTAVAAAGRRRRLRGRARDLGLDVDLVAPQPEDLTDADARTRPRRQRRRHGGVGAVLPRRPGRTGLRRRQPARGVRAECSPAGPLWAGRRRPRPDPDSAVDGAPRRAGRRRPPAASRSPPAAALVDGRGAWRVVGAWEQLAAATLRPRRDPSSTYGSRPPDAAPCCAAGGTTRRRGRVAQLGRDRPRGAPAWLARILADRDRHLLVGPTAREPSGRSGGTASTTASGRSASPSRRTAGARRWPGRCSPPARAGSPTRSRPRARARGGARGQPAVAAAVPVRRLPAGPAAGRRRLPAAGAAAGADGELDEVPVERRAAAARRG